MQVDTRVDLPHPPCRPNAFASWYSTMRGTARQIRSGWCKEGEAHNISYIYMYIYGPASLGTSPPPHPMVMGLYSSAPVPPSPLWCGWWWVVVYPPPPCGVGGGGWWWWWKKLYMYVYECISTPLPPVVWVVWVVVGGGGWWWWKKLYMYVYECI